MTINFICCKIPTIPGPSLQNFPFRPVFLPARLGGQLPTATSLGSPRRLERNQRMFFYVPFWSPPAAARNHERGEGENAV